MPEPPRRTGGARDSLAALAVAAIAVGCCAGLPLLVALAGSVAATTLLDAAGGIVAAVAPDHDRGRPRSCATPPMPRSRPASPHKTEPSLSHHTASLTPVPPLGVSASRAMRHSPMLTAFGAAAVAFID